MRFYQPTPDMVRFFGGGMGEHMVPLLTEAAHHRCSLALQDQGLTPFTVPTAGTWVVIIGDDPQEPATSLGPHGFHTGSLAALLRAAADHSLISCEIKPQLYRRQARFASWGFSGVIIETRVEHEAAWMAFLAVVAPGKLRTTALVDPKWRTA